MKSRCQCSLYSLARSNRSLGTLQIRDRSRARGRESESSTQGNSPSRRDRKMASEMVLETGDPYPGLDYFDEGEMDIFEGATGRSEKRLSKNRFENRRRFGEQRG